MNKELLKEYIKEMFRTLADDITPERFKDYEKLLEELLLKLQNGRGLSLNECVFVALMFTIKTRKTSLQIEQQYPDEPFITDLYNIVAENLDGLSLYNAYNNRDTQKVHELLQNVRKAYLEVKQLIKDNGIRVY